MKKLLLSIAAFAVLPCGSLLAQDITGTWQGTLQGPRELRAVFKISNAQAGGMNGVMYSIDQGGRPVPVNPVTLQGNTVKMTVPGIGGTYEGRLSADGNVIEGNWKQGPNPVVLKLTRATAETAWAIPEPPPPPKPMAADADPRFEVATIKPSNPEAPGKAFRVAARQFSTLNTTLNDMITFAYGIHARQIVNGPSWMETDKFDLQAQPDGEGQPNDRQWKTMVQKLLAERFELGFHRDKQELSVYAITVADGGPKLTKSEGDPNGLPGLFFRGLGNLPAINANMGDFAGLLQGAVLDRPVIDRTGISGRYDFTLLWTPDEFQFTGLGVRVPPPGNNPDAPPDLYTAMREQLGLKLESTKAPAEVFVIDRVQKPSEN